MLTVVDHPIRPVLQLPYGHSDLPTSPTTYELKRAFFRTIVEYAGLAHDFMDIYGSEDNPHVDQLFQEIDALVGALGDPDTKMFFYRPDSDNWRLCFDNPKFNRQLDPLNQDRNHKEVEQNKLTENEKQGLKLAQVQNALARFRDTAHIAKNNDHLDQLKEVIGSLERSLNRILFS